MYFSFIIVFILVNSVATATFTYLSHWLWGIAYNVANIAPIKFLKVHFLNPGKHWNLVFLPLTNPGKQC